MPTKKNDEDDQDPDRYLDFRAEGDFDLNFITPVTHTKITMYEM